VGFLSRVFGRKAPSAGLGLADPSHPARKWIDVATAIAQRRLTVERVDGRLAVRTDSSALRDLIGALDNALSSAADDADLLATRGAVRQMLNEPDLASSDLNAALRLCPRHVEASNLRKFGHEWNSLFFLPSWSVEATHVHPVIAEARNSGEFLQLVRFTLEPALILLHVGTSADFPKEVRRFQWLPRYSETPYGPVGAHYMLIDFGCRVHRQEYILSPPHPPPKPNSVPPMLLGRLPQIRICFLVVVEPNGNVLHNLRYILPAAARQTLTTMSRLFSETQSRNATSIRQSADWHMQHFDFNQIGFTE